MTAHDPIGATDRPTIADRPVRRERRIWGTDGRLVRHGRSAQPERDTAATTVATQAIARALLPISVMVALAELIKGYSDTGDGFSAGVILALGAVVQVAAFGISIIDRVPLLRWAPTAAFGGVLLALVIAFVPTLFGDPIMTHRPAAGAHVLHYGTLEVITAVAFDVSVCVLVFGFVVGLMTILARTASVAAIQQQQAAERLHSGHPLEPPPTRDLPPTVYGGAAHDRHGHPQPDRHGRPVPSGSAPGRVSEAASGASSGTAPGAPEPERVWR